MPMQRHFVVIPASDGGHEKHPLKEWARAHMDEFPPEMDVSSSTSHQLRAALKKQGWTLEPTPSEVLILAPGGEAAEAMDLGPVPDAPDPFFAQEFQLQDFLSSNLAAIPVGGKTLTLYVDQDGKKGFEYHTTAGRIDILAVDADGSFFVFELKRSKTSDQAFGQLARYMGWVKTNLSKAKEVYGVIVARSVSQNLRYAAATTPNVYLFEYEVKFSLKPAQVLAASGTGVVA